MPTTPIVFKTTHGINFSDLDPFNHMTTGKYATYYVDHRMQGLRERLGWDLKTLATLPFMTWVKRLEIDFIRPARGDQEITIASFGTLGVDMPFAHRTLDTESAKTLSAGFNVNGTGPAKLVAFYTPP